MTYKISNTSQHVQMISKGPEFVARAHNTIHGWVAHRVALSESNVLENVGEGVNVSRMINQHNGGDLIAQALGL